MSDEVVVAAIQMRVGGELEANLDEAERMISEATARDAKIILLPEYFYLPPINDRPLGEVADETFERAVSHLMKISRDEDVTVGACVIERDGERHFNTLFLFKQGEILWRQRKVHATAKEVKLGVSRWDRFDVVEVDGLRIGGLICADVLYPEACRVLGLLETDLVLNPVVSFYHDVDLTKDARECMFISRAIDNDYFLIKASSIGKTPWGRKIVGRSLIASPWGLLAKYRDENTPQVLTAALDLNLLRRLRADNYSLTDRVKDAYRSLVR